MGDNDYERDQQEFPVQIELRESVGDPDLSDGISWQLVSDSDGCVLESGHVAGSGDYLCWQQAFAEAHEAKLRNDREVAESNRAVDEWAAAGDRRHDEATY